MAILLRVHYKLAKDSIRKNRVRSFLTCLGIAVGVASIVLILSLTGSIKNMIAAQVKEMGADLILVRPARKSDVVDMLVDGLTASNQYMTSSLDLSDAYAIDSIDEVALVAPMATGLATLNTDERTIPAASVVGTSKELIDIQNLKLSSGTFLSKNVENSAVIGKGLSLRLFGTSTEAVGKSFKMGENTFIVVGMLEEMDEPINFNNTDFDNVVLVSENYLNKIGINFQVQQINVRSKTVGGVEDLATEITNLLEVKKSGDRSFDVLYGNNIEHPAGGMLALVSGMLTLVAGVSLVVGGIGVMNILLVSVAERTREIGIRKAVGASAFNILMQFLFESLILSLAGGTLGLILGYVAAFLISVFTPFTPYISWSILGITLGVSVILGVVFGIYPAVKAARKNPIESLRYYR